MQIPQTSFAGGELAPVLHYRTDLAKYGVGAKLIKNFFVHPHGGVSNRPGTTFVAEVKDSRRNVRLIPFSFSTIQTYVLEFGHQTLRVIINGAQVLESSKTLSGVTNASPAVVTTRSSHGYSSGDWVYISGVAGMLEINAGPFVIARRSSRAFRLTDVDGNNIDSSEYGPYSSGGVVRRVYQLSTPYSEDDLPLLKFTQSADVMTICHPRHAPRNLSRSGHTSWRLATFSRSSDPFNSSNKYPGAVTYFEQRRVYSRTNNDPQKLFFTRSGSYNSHSVNSTLRDDDAIQYTIAANEVNEVRHLIPIRKLIVLTSGGEWLAQGADGYIKATQPLEVSQQATRGVSHVRPITIGEAILFVQEKGAIVRDLSYTFESDSYAGNDLTILAAHLFEDRSIKEWAYAQTPHSIVWSVMSDGALLGLTYMREHQVFAWHRHETQGSFESICTISEGLHDAVYFVVRRTVGGRKKRYIERLHTRSFKDVKDAFFVDSGLSYDAPCVISGATQTDPIVITATAHGLSGGDLVDLEEISGMAELNSKRYRVENVSTNAFELTDAHSGEPIDGSAFAAYESGGAVRKAVTAIRGLCHLEGCSVAVLADGRVEPNKTVTGGKITLQEAASRVHVGLGYACDVNTLDLYFQGSAGRSKSIPAVNLMVNRTRGLFVGPDACNLKEIKQAGDPGLTSGKIAVNIPPTWRSEGSIYIRQPYPLPATILTVVPEMIVGR